VICGFGRLGTWFGIERWDVIPDMITFAKGVTSGYLPLGGVIVSDRIAEPFWRAPGGPVFRQGATYAGHATCAAAALANIELLERENLVPRGQEMEGPLLDALRPLADHPAAGEVRGGVGTLAAVELNGELLARDPAALGRLTTAARAAGVLLRQLGSSVAVSPPLTAQPEHFELIAQAIAAGLDAAAA
jgi:putrescine aminotransferase